MDILLKLRVVLWILILGLWADLTYQLMVGEAPLPETQMHALANPFPQNSLPKPDILPADTEQPPSRSHPSSLIVPMAGLATSAPSGRFIEPIPIAHPPSGEPPPKSGTESIRRHEFGPLQQEEAPPQYTKTLTRHFIVFSENGPPKSDFLGTLENLHSNLMIELAAFSTWSEDEKVTVFLYSSQNAYHQATGRPAWSGGASSVAKRTIYLYESDETIGILAHEMCHIFFDGYFLDGKPDPLWLSEGLATLVQVERGLSTPNWLPGNLNLLRLGGGFRFADLMRVTSTSGANDDNVRLWYAQSYSVVRFLIRLQGRASFFHFCRSLREGENVRDAIYHAYGMPYNRLQALEYAWRYNIRNRRLTSTHLSP